MAEQSGIQWTDSTFNPWSGCSKVSPACASCYAETNYSVKMRGVRWGPNGNRIVKAESGWKEPLKWNREAAKAGERRRVFCASLADVFEDWTGPMMDSAGDYLYCDPDGTSWDGQMSHPDEADGQMDPREGRALTMDDVRRRLFRLIDQTPNLDWLLLTKRPENIERMTPDVAPIGNLDPRASAPYGHPMRTFRPNVWLGTTCENQEYADIRIPHLLKDPAAVRFLSVEPMLGPVDLSDWIPEYRGAEFDPGRPLDWVICGCESLSKRPGRPMDVAWALDLRQQCAAAGVPFFMKQMVVDGQVCGDIERFPVGLQVREFPKTVTP